MTEIEKTEGEIKVLQAKLELLKEMENHKSPAEEAYKRFFGCYPDSGVSWNDENEICWFAFQVGYNASKEDYKVEEELKPKTLYEALYEVYYGTTYVCKEEIVDLVERWLPKLQQEAGDTEVYYKNKGWNNCIKKLKEMLR
jgi:hypothetical protein